VQCYKTTGPQFYTNDVVGTDDKTYLRPAWPIGGSETRRDPAEFKFFNHCVQYNDRYLEPLSVSRSADVLIRNHPSKLKRISRWNYGSVRNLRIPHTSDRPHLQAGLAVPGIADHCRQRDGLRAALAVEASFTTNRYINLLSTKTCCQIIHEAIGICARDPKVGP